MKIAYRDNLHLNKANTERLHNINKIIDEYADEGYKMTLRQLYYQLVSRDIIENKVSEYAKLSTLLVKGRMAGVVDWEAIEDLKRKKRIRKRLKTTIQVIIIFLVMLIISSVDMFVCSFC